MISGGVQPSPGNHKKHLNVVGGISRCKFVGSHGFIRSHTRAQEGQSPARTVSLSSRRFLPSASRRSTVSLRFPFSGMRVLPPILTLLTYPHRIGSPKRYSATDIPQNLKLMYSVSRHTEQLRLRSQHIVTTVEDSVLRTEMTGLESQEEDDPKRILFFKPMS